MPAHKKPKLLPIDAGPSAESLSVCGIHSAVGSVKLRHAAFMIGKSRAFTYELCKAGKLDSWIDGKDRVVALTSIALYTAEKRDAGRDRDRAEIGLKLHEAKRAKR